ESAMDSTDSVAASVMETILSMVTCNTFNAVVNEDEMCCENEDDYRTEMLTRTYNHQSPHRDR
ncbi:hypothetical protein AVEN_143133-1, partial [Araneus ventricosus]